MRQLRKLPEVPGGAGASLREEEREAPECQNIQRGCRKLAEICRELELPIKTLTWDTDEDGDWAEHVKGVDDYLHGLEQKK